MNFIPRLIFAMILAVGSVVQGAEANSLLHASFDLSRELCLDLNREFPSQFQKEQGRSVRIYQSHAGSAKQSRAILEGLPADVLSLNVPLDIDMLAAHSDLVERGWRQRFPWGASPCSSAVVFLVRANGGPRIMDWSDLVQSGRSLIVPHPKTSGNGRYAYLAALAFARATRGTNGDGARAFLTEFYRHVPILESGGRSATMTFIQRNIGDALVTLEAEALQVMHENPGRFEIVRPSRSVEVEVVVAIVNPVVRRRHSEALAKNYASYLFSPPGQELLARHFFRPRLTKAAQSFPPMSLIKVEELCGSWEQAQADHFAEGGLFDQIMASLR